MLTPLISLTAFQLSHQYYWSGYRLFLKSLMAISGTAFIAITSFLILYFENYARWWILLLLLSPLKYGTSLMYSHHSLLIRQYSMTTSLHYTNYIVSIILIIIVTHIYYWLPLIFQYHHVSPAALPLNFDKHHFTDTLPRCHNQQLSR